FAALGLDDSALFLLVHTGSRGLGEAILQDHIRRFKAAGLDAQSAEAAAYLARHDSGVAWARANRAAVAWRFLDAIGGDADGARRVLDICHNSVTPADERWLHRKGAAPADQGAVVIAGSRGDFSWLVFPLGDQSGNAFSL